ncbi:ankyrin repeat-containing domain protein [Xylaria sp. FL1777]|nr:ankyrin repeat-containing domain protein [Xylaria sp. FL1777]
MSQHGQDERYWAKAYSSLDVQLQASLYVARTGKLDILKAVRATAEQKREICIRKQWRAQLSNGEVIIVRDVVEKIIKWISKFVAADDAAMPFDPLTAALPWAAVRFVLQATISTTRVEGDIVSDLEGISRLISRYREFERIHVRPNTPMKPRLEECITSLYAGILTFLATTIKCSSSNDLSQTARDIVVITDGARLSNILQRETELLALAGLSDAESLHYLEDPVIRLVNPRMAHEKLLDETKHSELVSWLSKIPIQMHHKLKSDSRMLNSTTWLLNHPVYRSWKNSSVSSTLLLHGVAGSGKSIVCSAVIDSFLSDRKFNNLSGPVAYFYCDSSEFEPERALPSEILRSLLRQLTTGNSNQFVVNSVVLVDYERRLAQSTVDSIDMQKLGVQDCVSLILRITATDPLIIIIDALYEIDDNKLPELIEALRQIVANSSNVVKIFLTARSNRGLLSHDAVDQTSTKKVEANGLNVTKINISRDEVLKDMEAYVKLQLSIATDNRHLLGGNISPELTDFLTQRLVDGAGEVFQWVNIHVRHLCDQTSQEDVTNILRGNSLLTLDEIYSVILQGITRMDDTSRDIAIRTFSWLLYMKEAIPSQEFLRLVSANDSKRTPTLQPAELINICSNLLSLDWTCNIFRFSHSTVQGFLRRHDQFSKSSLNQLLATSCMHMCLNGPKIDDEAAQDDLGVLYNYAALYWPHHYSYAAEENEDLWANVSSFIYDGHGDVSDSFLIWIHNIEEISKSLSDHHPMKILKEAIPKHGSSPIFLASLYGLVRLIETIASKSGNIDWNQKNAAGHTGFYLACVTGNISVAEILLTHGADPIMGNPLEAVCFAGHSKIVAMLLAAGTSIQGARAFGKALDAAFRGGHEDIALMVLEGGAITNTSDYDFAIGGAAQCGFLQLIDWLERPPFAALYNAEDPNKMSMKLTRAIKGGQIEILQHFLGSELAPSSFLPDDALTIAAIYGHGEIIKLLVGMGFCLDNGGKLGSPLQCASAMGQEHIVRMILELGAEVDNRDNHATALQAAAMKGHTQIARLLLGAGADVNRQSGFYGTALQAAAYHGHCETVKLLLDSKARMELGGIARDAFHAAVEGRHYHIVKWFLDTGLRFHYGPPPSFEVPHSPKLDGLTPPLDEISYEDMLTGTFEPADHNTMSFDRIPGGYPEGKPYALHLSALRGDIDIVITMLHHRKSIRLFEASEINTALTAAASNGCADVVDVLIRAIAPLPESHAFPALEGAIAGGHLDIIRLLITNMNYRIWPQAQISNLLKRSCAVSVAVVDVVLQAVQRHASAHDLNDILGEGLKEASAYGRNEIIKWLFSRPTVINQPRVCSAFNAACKSGHESAAITILQLAGEDTLSTKDIYQGIVTSAHSGHVELVAYLTTYLLSRNEIANFSEPLLAATGSGQLGVVEWFLEKRTAWLTFDADAITALVNASLHGRSDIAGALLKAGADPNGIVPERIIDPNGFSLSTSRGTNKGAHDNIINPLQAAISRLRLLDRIAKMTLLEKDSRRRMVVKKQPVLNEENIVKLLLDHGADANNLGGRNELPIQIAAAHCSREVVQWLIESGADINAVASGESALFAAARRKNCGASIVQLLIDLGADVPVDGDAVKSLLNNALKHFRNDAHFGRGYEYIDYVSTANLNDIRTVFTDGPGAVIHNLLKTPLKIPQEVIADSKIALVLQRACVLNKSDFVRLLLDKGVDVDATGGYYGTALQAAARLGHAELVQLLLQQGADPNLLQGKHHTALRAAVIRGHAAIVEALLQYGTDINLSPTPHDGEEFVPLLTLAAEFGNAKIMSMLLGAGADVLLNVEGHQHPLIVAAERGDLEMVQCLLEAGAPTNIVTLDTSPNRSHGRKKTPLHVACFHGHEGIIQLLIDAGAEVEMVVDSSRTPLEQAAESGHVSAICILLQAGVNVNNGTAICTAAANGHLHAVSTLLAAGASIYNPTRQLNALKNACPSGSIPILELLLETATDLSDGNRAILEAFEYAIKYRSNPLILDLFAEYVSSSTAGLHKACIAGSVGLVTRMLDGGVAVDAQDDAGTRALDLAARHLYPEIVQCLLDHGADASYESPRFSSVINAAILGYGEEDLPQVTRQQITTAVNLWYDKSRRHNRHRRTPKPKQQELDCAEIVQILVQHGVNLQAEYREYGHSLHLACLVGIEPVVKILLSQGVDANSEAGHFKYPLFGAIDQCHEAVVKQLLEYGASPAVRHPELGPALSYACEQKSINISRLLLDHGADRNIRSPRGNTPLTDAITMGYNLASTNDWTALVTSFLRGEKRVQLCNDDLIAAASYWDQTSAGGWSILERLLEYDGEKTVPEPAIVALLQSVQYIVAKGDPFIQNRCDKLRLLLRRSGDLGVTGAMIKNVKSKEEMVILLAHEPRCRITADIAEAQQDWGLLKLLLDAEPSLLPSEKMVMVVINNSQFWFEKNSRIEFLEEMWKRNPSLQVNEDMLKKLNGLKLEEAQFLISKSSPELEPPHVMLRSAGKPLLQMLLKHKPDIKFTEHTILEMLEFNFPDAKLDTILDLIPNLLLTEAMFLKVFSRIQQTWKQRNQQLIDVLKKHGRTIHFTENIRETVDAAFQSNEEQAIRQAFYNLADSPTS